MLVMVTKITEHDKIYLSLGKFIVSFSELEHWLSCVLRVLTNGEENIWITLFFVDDLMTGRVRRMIEEVAKVRLEENPELLRNLKSTLKSASKLTIERNNIVHSQWRFDQTGRSPTKLWSFKLRKIKGQSCWQHLCEKAMTATKIKNLTKKANKLSFEMEQLRDSIESFLNTKH